tara:strand:- start:41 stop:1171 length:1131 start_codon:yes stop_codon:yes gene_type:complete
MKELDQLVENFFQPKQDTLGLDQLVEMVEEVMGEAVDEESLEAVKDLASKNNYEINQPKDNVVKIVSDERVAARDLFIKELEPLGFVFDPYRGGSMGRLVKPGVKGQTSQLVVLFKPKTARGGAAAAASGAELEEMLAMEINDKYSDEGIEASTAGFGAGSDLTIGAEGKEPLTIEVKTSLGADFGQFRLNYDTTSKEWSPTATPGYEKSKSLFSAIFKQVVGPYMNANASFSDLEHPSLRIKDGKIYSLSAGKGTGDYKKSLQSDWFSGKTDLKKLFDFKALTRYYVNKGDKFIQIGNKGLYALDQEGASDLGIPLFEDAGLRGLIRIRIKPHMGYDGAHSFTVAVKLAGKLNPSSLSLTNPDDLEKIIDRYKNS